MAKIRQKSPKSPKSRFLRSCSQKTSPNRCESRPGVRNGQKARFGPFSATFGLRGGVLGVPQRRRKRPEMAKIWQKWPKSRFLRSCSQKTSPNRCESRPVVRNGQKVRFGPFSATFRSPRGYFGSTPQTKVTPNGQNPTKWQISRFLRS